MWEQLTNVANAKQGNLSNNEWYDRFNTKVDVAESVGVSFNFEKIWEYCALEVHKAAYTSLQPDKQEAVRVSARERFSLYALIKMSNSKHDEIPGVDMVQEQEIDVDLDFAPADKGNVDPPLVDIPPPVNDPPVVSNVPTDGGTCRSMRVCMQPKLQYIPAFSEKSYSFATTAPGTKLLDDVDYSYNQSVAFSFMQQLSVKAALREWGDDAKVAGEKEVNQLHWREMLIPRQMLELTAEQQTKILQNHMFIGQKRTGETKARMVAGGNTQQGHMTKEELSSPTVATKAVLLTSIVDAHEGRDIAVIGILNAFI